MIDISTSYLGLKLKNPLIAGSCGLTDSLDNLKRLEESNIAAVVLKSLFEEEIIKEMESNLSRMSSTSFIYPETLEYYEHEYPDESTSDYLDLISKAKENIGIPVIASINCISTGPWTYFPKRIEEAGADALELNIFILPSDLKRSSADNEEVYFKIIEEIKKQINIPISIKISYYFSNLAQMIRNLSETGIAGVVLFNKFYNPDFDLDDLIVTSTNVLSHPEDISLSLRWVAIMSNRISCDIAASTGVHDGDGLIKQILAGANAVQIASTLYKNGMGQVNIMLERLKKWMEKKQYADLDTFRGLMSQAKSDDPAPFERVQFMKYFRGYKPA